MTLILVRCAIIQHEREWKCVRGSKWQGKKSGWVYACMCEILRRYNIVDSTFQTDLLLPIRRRLSLILGTETKRLLWKHPTLQWTATVGSVVEGNRRVGTVTLNSEHFVSHLLCLKTSKLLKMTHIKLIQQSHTVSENRHMCLLNLRTFEGIHSEVTGRQTKAFVYFSATKKLIKCTYSATARLWNLKFNLNYKSFSYFVYWKKFWKHYYTSTRGNTVY